MALNPSGFTPLRDLQRQGDTVELEVDGTVFTSFSIPRSSTKSKQVVAEQAPRSVGFIKLNFDNVAHEELVDESQLSFPSQSFTDIRECFTEFVNEERSEVIQVDEKISQIPSELLSKPLQQNITKGQYFCSECNKDFTTKYSFNCHNLIHSGQKPYECPTEGCGKSFRTVSDLNRHSLTHTSERPHVCTFKHCRLRFQTKSNLNAHTKTHSPLRTHECDCGSKFSNGRLLKCHRRMHSLDKPYECEFVGCRQRFKERSSLSRHGIVHSRARRNLCDVCGKRFQQASAMKRHKQRAHESVEHSRVDVEQVGSREDGHVVIFRVEGEELATLLT